ncbi:MAG TPA: nucleotidyltransferase family protein [Vicinamibacterales bacterium]|nr:nucleotidyltransferase family protein [Vicinamibacterales bacterium]
MTPAVVLAAGRSSRIGTPKALLTDGEGCRFVSRILATLERAGVDGAVVVVRAGDWEVSGEVARAAPFATAVENEHPDRGQLSSLVVGLAAVDRPGIDGVLVTLVDVPLVRASTVAALLARARAEPAGVIRPAFAGRHGHPVIFPRALFEPLRHAESAKAVVQQHAALVRDVEVDDAGCVEDVDTPADYARLFGRPPR